MSILLCVEGQNSQPRGTELRISQLVDLERVQESVSVAHSDHFGDLLDKFFYSRVVLGEAVVEYLQVAQTEHLLLGILRLKHLARFLFLTIIEALVEVGVVRVGRNLAHQLIDLLWLLCLSKLALISLGTVRIGQFVPFR